MPKRSNDFQRLITRIYEQLMPRGAVVTESAMLAETTSGELREVDVLIELPTPGTETPLRIAIECRDHSRRSDKTWIDALIGKYQDLPVDRVIAVSRQPFTAGAARKAQRAHIESRTVAEALETDWPQDLLSVDFTNVVLWPDVTEVNVVAEPPWPAGATPTLLKIGDMLAQQLGFTAWQRKRLADDFASSLSPDFATEGTFDYSTTVEHPQPPIVLCSPGGVEHLVRVVIITGTVSVELQPLSNTRYRMGRVGVTRADGVFRRDSIEALAVQEQGEKLSVRISHTRRAPSRPDGKPRL